MKKLVLGLLLGASALFAFGAEYETVYMEGWVDVKPSGDEVRELQWGDVLKTGDQVITDYDGMVELEGSNGATITVHEDTVFNILERPSESGTETVLATTLGRIGYKFSLLGKDQEPAFSTPSVVGGVRGTEFEVWVADDGTSQVMVLTGEVVVQAKGEMVELYEQEGVEIQPGQAPGEKFKFPGRELDYSGWREEKFEKYLQDPVASVQKIQDGIFGYYEQVYNVGVLYKENFQELGELRADVMAQEPETAQRRYKEEVLPLELETSREYLTIRFNALSALSYKQHVLSGLQARMLAKYFDDRENPVFVEYEKIYRETVDIFDEVVAPYLGDYDY